MANQQRHGRALFENDLAEALSVTGLNYTWEKLLEIVKERSKAVRDVSNVIHMLEKGYV